MDGKDPTPPTEPGPDTGADDTAERIDPAPDPTTEDRTDDAGSTSEDDSEETTPDGESDDASAADDPAEQASAPPSIEADPGDPYGGTPPWLRQGSTRRSLVGIGLTLALVLGVAAVGWFLFRPADAPADADETVAVGSCDVVESDDGGLLIAPPTLGESAPRLTATVVTNFGEITVLLFGDVAPCGVSGFDYLSNQGFYNGSGCFRVTTQPTDPTVVLRCGDPTGTGDGGPGYRFRAERKFTDEPVFDAFALINDSSGRAGSSFAFLRGQSLPTASVSVIGQVIDGFEVLDQIGGGAGLDPYDGAPPQPVTILSVTIAQGTVTLPPTTMPSGTGGDGPTPTESGMPGLPSGLPTSRGPGDGTTEGGPATGMPGLPGRTT